MIDSTDPFFSLIQWLIEYWGVILAFVATYVLLAMFFVLFFGRMIIENHNSYPSHDHRRYDDADMRQFRLLVYWGMIPGLQWILPVLMIVGAMCGTASGLWREFPRTLRRCWRQVFEDRWSRWEDL